MLKIIGIWPEEEIDLCEKIKFILMILVSITVIVPETVFGLTKPDGFTSKTQTIGSIIAVVGFTLKYIILYKNRDEFKILVGKLQEAYTKARLKKYGKIVELTNRKSQLITKYYSLLLCCLTMTSILIGIIAKFTGLVLTSLSLPYIIGYGSNINNIIIILWYTMFFVKSVWLTVGVACIDCTFVSLGIHICSHFKILNKMIRNIGYKSKKKFGYVGNCQKCIKSSYYLCEHNALKQLKSCIKNHNVLIKYVEDFEKLFRSQMMIDFNLHAVKTCLFLFQASINTTETKKFLIFIGFATGSLLQLFMFANYGQQILTESSEIANAAFECAWYKYSKNFQKILILVIQRAQKPVGFTVGKFYYISMECFAKICSAAASYFTVLRALREK